LHCCAVNVGGTGKLPTTELQTMCVGEGFAPGCKPMRIPAAAKGTARNINTIAKLVELASGG
jgi:uncharacterized protein (DUF1697 family)